MWPFLYRIKFISSILIHLKRCVNFSAVKKLIPVNVRAVHKFQLLFVSKSVSWLFVCTWKLAGWPVKSGNEAACLVLEAGRHYFCGKRAHDISESAATIVNSWWHSDTKLGVCNALDVYNCNIGCEDLGGTFLYPGLRDPCHLILKKIKCSALDWLCCSMYYCSYT